ncbi:MAG: hypothetical protein KIG63_03005 [Methanobrevibacter sp.]|nr:hypothetical protein [Methanobrevibacter sp.]
MVREVAPNLSYHYWGLGVRGLELDEEADPLVMVRGSEFNHEREIETEDDEGHMGTATIRMSSYRTKASANPSFTDKCRYKEGWEDMFLLLLGSDDGTLNHAIRKQAVSGAEGVFEYTFKINVASPQDPYFATLYNGFAKTSTDAYKYEDALLSEFELSGSNEEAPTYTSTFATNYPKVNQTNPARVFPATTVFPKSADVKLYIAPQGTYTEESIKQYEYPCYLDWSLSVNNNIESVPCSGDDFGESTKVLGNREGEVNITLPWTSATKFLEKEFETGSAEGTTVTTNNDVKTIWVVMENTTIGSTDKKYKTVIKVPQVVLTSVYSEQSGSDAKNISLEGNIEESGTDSFMEVTITTDLADLHIDNTKTTSP